MGEQTQTQIQQCKNANIQKYKCMVLCSSKKHINKKQPNKGIHKQTIKLTIYQTHEQTIIKNQEKKKATTLRGTLFNIQHRTIRGAVNFFCGKTWAFGPISGPPLPVREIFKNENTVTFKAVLIAIDMPKTMQTRHN